MMDNHKILVACLLLTLIAIATAQERTQWCEGDHDHDHDHYDEGVHPEDFLYEIFQLYGTNETCTISEHDFEHLLVDLGIGGDDDHAHGHAKEAKRRKRRSVDHSCYTAHELLDVYNISHSVGISEDEFTELSPSLVQQIVQGCATHEEDSGSEPTPGETYGYGTISVILISLCAPLGLLIVPWSKTSAYKYIMATMLGLAVGTLTGDALIHLIPHGLGLHDHEDEGHDHESGVETFVWKSFISCVAIWAFFNLQMFMQVLSKGAHSHDGAPSDKQKSTFNQVAPNQMNGSTQYTVSDKELNGSVMPEHKHVDIDEGLSDDVKADPSVAWMITVGDAIHNFADGLAIGAAFTVDWQTGLSTSLAVMIHELAHEFGDVAVLLSTGWGWKRVFSVQLLTQAPALIGLYIGIPIAETSEDAQQWILCLAAGMFLYIALCDIVPELGNYIKIYNPYKMLLCINGGLSLGFVIMLLIGAFEGSISF